MDMKGKSVSNGNLFPLISAKEIITFIPFLYGILRTEIINFNPSRP